MREGWGGGVSYPVRQAHRAVITESLHTNLSGLIKQTTRLAWLYLTMCVCGCVSPHLLCFFYFYQPLLSPLTTRCQISMS